MRSLRSCDGFLSAVEVMILIVIIGLLAGMAIPAFVKVCEASIVKRAESGQSVSAELRAEYREIMKRRGKAGKNESLRASSSSEVNSQPESDPTVPFQRVSIEGKGYYLIPKRDAKETEIAGKTFWLIPESN